MQTDSTQTKVVIVGAGFGGLGLAIRLKQSGLHDFVILEKSDAVGGVWARNRYPGAACDVPAHLYSFSFEPRPDWPQRSTRASRQILDYLQHCARKYELAPHIRFGAEVSEARWDEGANRWIVRTSDERVFEARALVAASGQLSRPICPPLPGRERFAGALFHSADWPDTCDLRGRRVAVIGTGASAIQIVPAIAPEVDILYLFQRSAPYVLRKPDRTYPHWQKHLFRRWPATLWLSRLLTYLDHEQTALAFVTWRAALRVKQRAFLRRLQRSITRQDLIERLIPDYRMGCKRILLSNDFYPAMNRDNVELVTERITEIASQGIVTADGVERNVDSIILATGFAATEFLAPMRITGIAGRDLHQCWQNGAQAYYGMTVAGFPNFFMLSGPNSSLVHNSVVFMIESQIRYVVACLMRLGRGTFARSRSRRRARRSSTSACSAACRIRSGPRDAPAGTARRPDASRRTGLGIHSSTG